jgi:hypothetical protein
MKLYGGRAELSRAELYLFGLLVVTAYPSLRSGALLHIPLL